MRISLGCEPLVKLSRSGMRHLDKPELLDIPQHSYEHKCSAPNCSLLRWVRKTTLPGMYTNGTLANEHEPTMPCAYVRWHSTSPSRLACGSLASERNPKHFLCHAVVVVVVGVRACVRA